jgi:hypothetical protein
VAASLFDSLAAMVAAVLDVGFAGRIIFGLTQVSLGSSAAADVARQLKRCHCPD